MPKLLKILFKIIDNIDKLYDNDLILILVSTLSEINKRNKGYYWSVKIDKIGEEK